MFFLRTASRSLLLICILLSTNGAVRAEKAATDDGPYVFLLSADSAKVVYFCGEWVAVTPFEFDDTLRFAGQCHDSTTMYVIASDDPTPAPAEYDNVPKILALSDIHGEYDHLIDILQSSGVIDSSLHWSWGEGHLVIDGDVFDRGAKVTECLWLLHRLEREASVAGGAVHFLLGNHELMVLQGDLRYLNEKYTTGPRTKAPWSYDELYGPTSELGRWLRSKNTIVRLNDVLFVHGGLIPSQLVEYGGIDGINTLVRKGIDVSRDSVKANDSLSAMYRSLGPLWYRGFIYGIEDRYEAATDAQIDSVLQLCDVDRIVVGHSEQDTVTSFHDGRVVAIDVDVEALGGLQALLWEDGKLWRMDDDGERSEL